MFRRAVEMNAGRQHGFDKIKTRDRRVSARAAPDPDPLDSFPAGNALSRQRRVDRLRTGGVVGVMSAPGADGSDVSTAFAVFEAPAENPLGESPETFFSAARRLRGPSIKCRKGVKRMG